MLADIRAGSQFTEGDAQTLRALTVTESEPGAILHDMQALIGFVQGRRLQVSKTHQLLPLKVLSEINARLAHPVELGLSRPQLRSYPHIQGLYLLLRVTGLGDVRGSPSRPILAIDEATLASWSSLNTIEQYFTLLEAWLMRGDVTIVGERHRPASALGVVSCAGLMRAIGDGGMEVAGDDRMGWYLDYAPGRMGIALLEEFGLLAVEHGAPAEGEGWQIERIDRTPLGNAVFRLLATELLTSFEPLLALEDRPPEEFGVLQPIFQPYVPAWQRSLTLSSWEFRAGTYVFKVALGQGLWRRIATPGGLLLQDLASAILDAYDFDYDHLYEFSYRDRFGREASVSHPYMDEGPWVTEVRVGDVPLAVGERMGFLYDFGDWWQFTLTLEQVDPPDPSISEPVLLAWEGEAPEQYPGWDEEDWDEEDGEEEEEG